MKLDLSFTVGKVSIDITSLEISTLNGISILPRPIGVIKVLNTFILNALVLSVSIYKS